jgi:serine protease
MREGLWVAMGGAVRAGVMAFACIAVSAPVVAQPVAPGLRPANGLIVKFKDAPPNEHAHVIPPGATRTLAQQETARVQRVLAASGLDAVRLRPAGRAAQHLDFGAVLSGKRAQQLAHQLRQRPEVEWVVPNERERRLQVRSPSDFYFSDQWWLHPVGGSDALPIARRLRGVPGFQTAWSTELGKATAVVAVLDTGITRHPDLDAHVLPGYDFVSTLEYANDGNGRDADPSDPGDWVSQDDKKNNPAVFGDCVAEDSSWHGTDIAGIVAGVTNNGSGVAGINWNGRVLPVRVAGKCGAEVKDIVDGMYWAAGFRVQNVPDNPPANWAKVVNISFGGSDPCNDAYQTAINDLRAVGVVVVAAAGNEHGALSRPASCAGVVGVAALNRDGFKANYSNFGPGVVVSTVGGDWSGDGAWGPLLGDDGLLTLDNRGTKGPCDANDPVCGVPYSYVYGTSFATPVVAGAVGLMLSTHPSLTVDQIIDGLRRSARPHVTSTKIGLCSAQNPGRCICTTSTCGAGILDAFEAVRFAQDMLAGRVFMPRSWPTEVLDSLEVRQAAALGPDLPPNSVAPPADEGGGGGAVSAAWLLALVLAVVGAGWAAPRRAAAVRLN